MATATTTTPTPTTKNFATISGMVHKKTKVKVCSEKVLKFEDFLNHGRTEFLKNVSYFLTYFISSIIQ